ncbi:MAG: hypothetical protein KFW07_04215 [Mycoplasmataceae bacterium]|nr:hypothetical protein [Mycoplasmataceae bacterium]
MKIFESQRIKNSHFKINNFKHNVPYTVVHPLEVVDESKVIIFMNGLNGTRNWMKYYNHTVFNNNFLLSFDQKGQADNMSKPSKFYRTLINDNLKILEHIKKSIEFKNRDIILIGESWGANCSLLIAKKRPELIKGFLIWNMPGKLPSRNKKVSNGKLFSLSVKTLFTNITNINTKSEIIFDERLSSNNLLIRASKNNVKKYENNKTSIAVYFSMSPSWNIIIKNKLSVPFIYIQSMQDIMFSKSRFDQIKEHNNVFSLEKGYHVLILEKNSKEVFDKLDSFINNLKI